jgi:hypothetical protein
MEKRINSRCQTILIARSSPRRLLAGTCTAARGTDVPGPGRKVLVVAAISGCA